jgi:peptidoglycan/LPS O-acetylase OafA/YrhL
LEQLTGGGCPGVALFFTISGFVLVKSVEKSNVFFKWWSKKILRLYTSLTIVNIIIVLLGYREPSLLLFVFPINSFWYVPAITLLYIPYYVIVKNLNRRRCRIIAFFLAIVLYFSLYILRYRESFFVEPEVGFRLIYGFIAMMIGSIIYDEYNSERKSKSGSLWILLAVMSCVGFLASKIMMGRVEFVMKIQFITQVFGVAFATFSLMAGNSYEKQIQQFMKKKMGRLLSIISTCSLEIFLVQFAIIDFFKPLTFPVNFVLIIVGITGISYLIHLFSKPVFEFCVKKLKI